MKKTIEEILEIKKFAFSCQLARNFSLLSFYKTMLNYIECNFTMVVKTENFSKVDYASVSKILASSSLQVDTEFGVFHAANAWLSYNIKERSRFAKNLLLKVRLHLLSSRNLEYLLNESSYLSKTDPCVEILDKSLRDSLNQKYSDRRKVLQQ